MTTMLRVDKEQGVRSPDDRAGGMVWIPGRTFRMGSDRHYPEEAPAARLRSAASGSTGRR